MTFEPRCAIIDALIGELYMKYNVDVRRATRKSGGKGDKSMENPLPSSSYGKPSQGSANKAGWESSKESLSK